MEKDRAAQDKTTRRNWFALAAGALSVLLIGGCGKKNNDDDD
jgi:hypothetical protein